MGNGHALFCAGKRNHHSIPVRFLFKVPFRSVMEPCHLSSRLDWIRILICATVLVGSSDVVRAIPQSFFGNGFIGPIIPAHPRFGKNLTGAFLSVSNWEKGELPGPWETQPALAGTSLERMTANPILFGAVPDSVVAHREEGGLHEIAITYLDAGSFFGFKFGGEKTNADRAAGSKRRLEFESHFTKLERNLRERLESGCGRGTPQPVGRSDLLRTVFTDYVWEDFVLRLSVRQGHSVGLSIYRKGEIPDSFVAEAIAGLDQRQRKARTGRRDQWSARLRRRAPRS